MRGTSSHGMRESQGQRSRGRARREVRQAHTHPARASRVWPARSMRIAYPPLARSHTVRSLISRSELLDQPNNFVKSLGDAGHTLSALCFWPVPDGCRGEANRELRRREQTSRERVKTNQFAQSRGPRYIMCASASHRDHVD